MPCNNKKDFTKLVSKRRISLFQSRHFFDAYLWRDRGSLRANQVVCDEGNPWHVVPAKDDASALAEAFVCRMPEFARVPPRTRWRWLLLHCAPESVASRFMGFQYKCFPKIGELHFSAGANWSMEIVSHECCHAAISAAHAFEVNPTFVFECQGELSEHFANTPILSAEPDHHLSDEELFCYIHGTIFEQVYRWLWEVDPPRKIEAT